MDNGFENIKEYLAKQGFEFENNVFTKKHKHRQVVVINGQQHTNDQEVTAEFEYIGDGYVEDTNGNPETVHGLQYRINGQVVTDFWARDSADLRSLTDLRALGRF